jgi:hypothetical protein
MPPLGKKIRNPHRSCGRTLAGEGRKTQRIQVGGVVQKHEPWPVLRVTLDRRKRAVRHEETAPEGRFEPERVAEDRPQRPPVGGNQDGFPLLGRRIEDTAGPPLQGEEIFAAGRASDPPPAVPRLPLFRKTIGNLLVRQPLPKAVIAFPEFRRRQNRDGPLLAGGDDPGRFKRPVQIARIDPFQRDRRQAGRQGLGLFSPPFMEGNVRLPLDPLVPIPCRFAMSNEIDDGNGSPPFRGKSRSRPAPRFPGSERRR